MKRISIAAVILLCCAAPLFASHQKLPSKKEAEAMLRQAADAANLWEAGTPPYHLSAIVHLELGKQEFEGRYDLWWAAPDKYREGFLMPAKGGTIVETDLALGDKFYVLRNTPTLSIPLWELRKAMRAVPTTIGGRPPNVVLHPFATESAYVSRVFSTKHGRMRETCLEIRYKITIRRPLGMGAGNALELAYACFDPSNGDILSITRNADPGVVFPTAEQLAKENGGDASHFIQMGAKRYPSQIETRNFDLTLNVTVMGLVQTTKFDSDTFQPLPHSVVWDWCADPTYDEQENTVSTFDPTQLVNNVLSPLLVHMPYKYVAYYIRVRSDGRVSYLMPLRSGGPAVDGHVKAFLSTRRYGAQSCGGHAIPWEGIVNELPIFQP